VIYCSSFSKTLSPGVRIGWMIAGKFQQEIQRLQTFSTHSACSVTQMALASYLENGGYDRHLRYIRQEHRKNLSAFQLAVQQMFPEGTQMTRPTRWLHFLDQLAGQGEYPGAARPCAAAGHQHRARPDLQQYRAIQSLYPSQLWHALESRGGEGA
jgi:DNA-binding transcriptional MocR family regulator